MTEEKQCLIIGHRGCGYPDFNPNTIRAFKKIAEEGAPAFEFDVQLTADQKLIIIHNLDLSEVSTGNGPVNSTTWEEISNLYAGNPDRGKDRIPQLSEVFELVASLPADKRMVMHLELKGAGTGVPCGKLIRQWLDSKSLSAGDFLISSFDWQEIRLLQKHCPELQVALLSGAILKKELLKKFPCGQEGFHKVFAYSEEDFILPKKSTFEENRLLVDEAYSNPAEREILYDVIRRALDGDFYNETLLKNAEELKAVAINLWYRSLTVDFMKKAQQRGFQVNIFTVNDTKEIQQWARAGVDGIFTDFYRDAKAALSRS